MTNAWAESGSAQEDVLTQGHEAAHVLQHHISVQVLLSRVQELLLVPCEAHSHILK